MKHSGEKHLRYKIKEIMQPNLSKFHFNLLNPIMTIVSNFYSENLRQDTKKNL